MSEYNPGAETRGTCRYCERRVRVSVPRGGDGSARVCCRHDLPARCQAVRALDGEKRCPGSRTICLEDERDR